MMSATAMQKPSKTAGGMWKRYRSSRRRRKKVRKMAAVNARYGMTSSPHHTLYWETMGLRAPEQPTTLKSEEPRSPITRPDQKLVAMPIIGVWFDAMASAELSGMEMSATV